MNQPTPQNVVDAVEVPQGVHPAPSDQAPAAAVDNPSPHDVERAVMTLLQNHPSLTFTRLCVHQCGHDSICLEGFLESNDADIDLAEIVRGIHGIRTVVNRVINQRPIPKKG